MASSNEKVKNKSPDFWWWLFPFTGLVIKDDAADLDEVLFPVGTVLSKKAAQELLRSHTSARGFDDSMQFLFSDRVDCVIAIKKHLVHSNWKDEAAEAEALFEKVAAALTLFSLVRYNYGQAYGPTYSLSTEFFGCVALREKDKTYQGSSEIRNQVVFPRELDSFSKTDLLNEISNSEIGNVIKVIGGDKLPIHISIRDVISRAAWRLSKALYAGNDGDIVASVVTCFDILLKPANDSDETVTKRLDVLVGFIKNEIARLRDYRNKWIHEGIVPNKQFTKRAIIFAVESMYYLVETAINAPKETTHQAILQWLDLHSFVRVQQKIKPDALKKLVDHFKDKDPFVIADRVLRTTSVGIYALSIEKGILPSWSYSLVSRCNIPSEPVQEVKFDDVYGLTSVLQKCFEQHNTEVDVPLNKQEWESIIQRILKVGSKKQLQQKTIYIEIKISPEDYELIIPTRTHTKIWSYKQPFVAKIPLEEGVYKLAETISQYLQTRTDLSHPKRKHAASST